MTARARACRAWTGIRRKRPAPVRPNAGRLRPSFGPRTAATAASPASAGLRRATHQFVLAARHLPILGPLLRAHDPGAVVETVREPRVVRDPWRRQVGGGGDAEHELAGRRRILEG